MAISISGLAASPHSTDAPVKPAEPMSMRRVADALGTGPASLYAHVDDKEDLLAILVDRAVGEAELPAPDSGPWQEQVKAFVRLVRTTLTNHRDLARASMGVIPTGPNVLRVTEWLLGILRGAGLPDQVCAYACDLLPLYGTAIAFEEGLFMTTLGGVDIETYVAEVRERLESLSSEQYPNVTGMVDSLMRSEGDERFEFGLAVLVAGLAAQAKTR